MNFQDQLALQGAVRKMAKMGANIQTEIENALVEKDTLFFKMQLSGKSGIVQLLKPSHTETDGVRNIDSARLAGGTHFVVTGIAISTGISDKPVSDLEIPSIPLSLSTESKSRGSSPKFFESELSIKIANKEKIKSVLRHLMPENHSDNSFEEQAYKVSPFVIPANAPILPELNLFTQACPVDQEVIIEVAMTGYKITENAR